MKLFYSAKFLMLSFIVVVALVAIGFWLYLNVQASMHVSARNADIQLSRSLPTKINVGNYLEAQSIGVLDTQINLNQNIDLPLKGNIWLI